MSAAINTSISERIEPVRDALSHPCRSVAVRVRPCVSIRRHDWLWAAVPPACVAAAFLPILGIRSTPLIALNIIIICALVIRRFAFTQSSDLSPQPVLTQSSALSPRSLFSLTKPLLTLLVLGTTLAGFWLGSRGHLNVTCVVAFIGTALVAAGSLAINEHDERDLDAMLSRTARRPIPSGAIDAATALRFGIALVVVGLVVLLGVGAVPAFLAANAFAIYIFIYTPLKRITPVMTLIGAVSGALPPLIGWSAVAPLDSAAWRLFVILFLWQIPHFLAIGWRWRDDYARAGVPVYCALDPTGRATGLHMLNYSIAVVAVSLFGASGGLYGCGAVLLGALLVFPCAAFALRPSRRAARRVFLATVIYMPLLLTLMAAGL